LDNSGCFPNVRIRKASEVPQVCPAHTSCAGVSGIIHCEQPRGDVRVSGAGAEKASLAGVRGTLTHCSQVNVTSAAPLTRYQAKWARNSD